MKTVTTYDREDYDEQHKEVENMSLDKLITAFDSVDEAALSDYCYSGTESDFRNHRNHMVMYRVFDILTGVDKKYKVVEIA